MQDYDLPVPDFVIGDVGSTIYRVGPGHTWQPLAQWEEQIAPDWAGRSRQELAELLEDVPGLRLQEAAKQNRHKLSYYTALTTDREALSVLITERLEAEAIHARLVWSTDEPAGVGLLDVLPERASKYHAICALMKHQGFTLANTVFCGDRILAVSAIKWTPQKTITSASVPAALRLNSRESPV